MQHLIPPDPSREKRLWTHVDRLAGVIGSRHLGLPHRLNAAAAYIENEFAILGYSVMRQTYSVNDQEAVNLIAQIDGHHRANEIVVVGAHYDTVEDTPGADDNASAVAVLLETARILRHLVPSRTIRFVAFTCEEPPHFYTTTMGSQVYARQCKTNGERIVGMLCLEMLGYYSNTPESQQFPTGLPRFLRRAFPRQGNFIAAVTNLRSWRLGIAFRRGFKKAVKVSALLHRPA